MKNQNTRIINKRLDSRDPVLIWEKEQKHPIKQGMLLDMYACNNPECRFLHATVFAVDERFENLGLEPDGSLRFDIKKESDIATPLPDQKITASINIDFYDVIPGESSGSSPVDLLDWLSFEAKNNLCEYIQSRWHMDKPKDNDQWKQKDWSWWETDMMVGWDEIYPHDPNLLLHMPDKKYWVIDAYCVNPQCNCKNMGLSFLYATENKTQDVGGMLVDLNNFLPDQIIPRSKSSTELTEMWKTFLAQPGIKKELGRRQKKMQKIGKELVKLKTVTGSGKVPTTSKSGAVKVGRNDPCPCGSGKKFKKCCY